MEHAAVDQSNFRNVSVLSAFMNQYTVKAAKTLCPGIVVHEAFGVDANGVQYPRWSVTQLSSGVAVAHARTYEAARKVAAILSAFPIDWTKGRKPLNYGDAKQLAREIMARVPADFRVWLKTVNVEGAL